MYLGGFCFIYICVLYREFFFVWLYGLYLFLLFFFLLKNIILNLFYNGLFNNWIICFNVLIGNCFGVEVLFKELNVMMDFVVLLVRWEIFFRLFIDIVMIGMEIKVFVCLVNFINCKIFCLLLGVIVNFLILVLKCFMIFSW